jgi:hypothetical protein
MAISPQSMAQFVQSADTKSLGALMTLLQQEPARRKAQMEDTYGNWFCDIVGIERIYALAVVDAKQLNLDTFTGKCPDRVVIPSMLGKHTAVRGTFGNKPLIAIKLEILCPATKKVEGVVVEVIFKKSPLDMDGGKGKPDENRYLAANTKTDNGTYFNSCLGYNGLFSMNKEQVTAVEDLLKGKTIVAVHGPKYLIRMAK